MIVRVQAWQADSKIYMEMQTKYTFKNRSKNRKIKNQNTPNCVMVERGKEEKLPIFYCDTCITHIFYSVAYLFTISVPMNRRF